MFLKQNNSKMASNLFKRFQTFSNFQTFQKSFIFFVSWLPIVIQNKTEMKRSHQLIPAVVVERILTTNYPQRVTPSDQKCAPARA